jgi:NCAIR mutase (PurE)-related protein
MPSLKEVLEKVANKEITPKQAEKILKLSAIDQVGCLARLDGNREIRRGVPEIILAEGKSANDIADIAKKMVEKTGRVILSRCSAEQVEAVEKVFGKEIIFQLNDKAKMLVVKKKNFSSCKTGGKVAILTAGTSDISVAEEAKVVAEEMGCDALSYYDVGVAGIHRLLEPMRDILSNDADVVVVVAGREGALASVVSGLVDVPVVAVPTSNSYGFGGKGVGALMAMLQACSLGLAVVNIDSGVAAGAVAALIANRVSKFRKEG